MYLPRPCGIEITSKPEDFILEYNGVYYLFCHNLPMALNPDVAISREANFVDEFAFDKKIKSITAMDDDTVTYEVKQENGVTTIKSTPYVYGTHLAVRVAKIEVEE